MIPNVSAIYRDLANMGSPQATQSYPSHQPSPSPYTLKQERHQQLMDKLRNAQQQAAYLGSQMQPQSSHGSSSHWEPSYQAPTRTNQSFSKIDLSSFDRKQPNNSSSSSWKPPNIRYRHIEDFKKPQYPPPHSIPSYQIQPKQALQKEFYDSPGHQVSQPGVKEAVSKAQQVQKQSSDMERQRDSEVSYGQTWMNRESKFEEKLSSYYDLCKKRPVSSKVEPKANGMSRISAQKFQRRTGDKVPVMELENAIKLLAFD